MKIFVRLIWLIAAILASTAYAAAAFPDKPVKILIGYTAGGGTDILARMLAQKLTEMWGQSVIVENRPGAQGTIASSVVAQSKPDGYTLLMVSPDFTVSPSFTKLSFDPVKNFAPISWVTEQQQVLLVNPSVPVSSVSELIDYAKKNPKKLNIASVGTGGIIDLIGRDFMHKVGIDLVSITYAGTSAGLVGVLSGEAQVMLASKEAATSYLDKLRPLAVSTPKGLPSLPNVPPLGEAANLPGFSASTWQGVLAPAGTPPDVVATISAALSSVLKQPDMEAKLDGMGFTVVASSPAEFGTMIEKDIVRWRDLKAALGL